MRRRDNLRLMRDALAAGADEAEVYWVERRLGGAEVDDTGGAEVTSGWDGGVALRVVRGGRMGFAAASWPAASPQRLVTAALDACGQQPGDAPARPALALPGPDEAGLPPAGSVECDPGLDGLSGRDRLELVRRALAGTAPAARRLPAGGVDWHVGARFEDCVDTVFVCNSRGLERSARTSRCYFAVLVRAGAGGSREQGHAETGSCRLEHIAWEDVLHSALEAACLPLGGRVPRAGEHRLGLTARAAAGLLAQLAPALSAELAQQGLSSLARDRAPLASPLLVISDEGGPRTVPWWRPFDDEGVAGGRRALVVDGRLQGVLHTATTAARAGVAPTGHAWRNNYTDPPQVRPACLVLTAAPGVAPFDGDPASAVGDGLLVTDLSYGYNPVTGQTLLRAKGACVRGGEPAGSFCDAALAASSPAELLCRVTALGDRMEAVCDSPRNQLAGHLLAAGGCLAPALVLEGIEFTGGDG